MKKFLLSLFCILAILVSFSQNNSYEYLVLQKIGDSLYNVKNYQNSGLTFDKAIIIAGPEAQNFIRWRAACSWALANYPDNAFAHLIVISNSKNLTFEDIDDGLTDDDFEVLHNDKRWQEIKKKMYSVAKATFFSEMNKSEYNFTASEQFNIAVAWALMKNRDSAFFYLNKISKTKDNPYFLHFGRVEAFSDLHKDKRWLPVTDAIYTNAANIFSLRARSENWANPTIDGYQAARAWALANEPDSAFYYLDKIVNTNYNVFTRYNQLAGAVFASLHNDKRWQPLLETVKKNFTAGNCDHTIYGPSIPMTFTIDPLSSFLKSDGKGVYRNKVDRVSSLNQHPYNLLLSGYNPFEYSYDKNDLSSRSLSLDLNSPVLGSGAVAKGAIIDRDASFHIFYKFDRTVSPMMIYDFREIPIGATIESHRTEVGIHINGVFHTFQMGTWALGDCNEGYSYKGSINGIGTTMVRVTRHSESKFTIEAQDGSIGRLWNTQNMTKPVDLGLFKTGFIIHLEEQQ